jgi:hypothetical protein
MVSFFRDLLRNIRKFISDLELLHHKLSSPTEKIIEWHRNIPESDLFDAAELHFTDLMCFIIGDTPDQ